MQLALGFCQKDADQALELLQWIAELGGCKNHECLIIVDAGVEWSYAIEALNLANKSFRYTRLHTTSVSISCSTSAGEEERKKAWLKGSSMLFKEAAIRCAGQPFFWLESDSIPLKPNWLDQIEHAYQECGAPFMGPLVKHKTAGYPSPYLEGISVYPADCWKRFEKVWDENQSWCLSCATAAVPYAANTPLVQQIWGQMGMAVSFVKVRTADSQPQDWTLDMINPKAVVFHRNKDGSLLKLLREQSPDYANPPVFVQMGRVGDLILLLPAFQAWAERSGKKTVVITSKEFGGVLEGASYVQPVMLNMTWFEAGAAKAWASTRYPRVVVTQLHGAGISVPPDDMPSYSLTMWERTGLLAEYQSLPVVFDQRVPHREQALIKSHVQGNKPILLVKFDGWTSPFEGGPAIKDRLQHWASTFQIIDLDHVMAHRAFDLLGFYDIATGLITGDTMTLHLAAASDLQFIAYTRDDLQSGSIPKRNCVLNIGYSKWNHEDQIRAFDFQIELWSRHPRVLS
jgi:hypothetical protein